MPNPSISLRSADPTIEDGQLFARYLDQAAEGFFGFMLGGRSVDILARAFLHPDHDLSYQHVTFAAQNRHIVGMISGYTATQHHHASDQPLKQAAGKYNLRFMLVSLLFAPLMRILDTITNGDYYLQAIAVDKELRGEGLGSALMDLAENRAQTCDSKRICLDVSADNGVARKSYEQRGMTIESQWPRRLAIPKFRLYRMTKVL